MPQQVQRKPPQTTREYGSGRDELLIDGFEGVAIINPSESTLFRYGKVDVQRRKLLNLIDEESGLPAQTADGKKLNIWANADTPEEVQKAGSDPHGEQ